VKLFGVIYLFADDISILISAKTYAELQLKIDSDLRLTFDWFQKNKLVINYQKCNYMVTECPKKDSNLLVNLGQNNLKRVNETEILGVIFDNDFRFDNHINNIYKSISNRISFLSRLRYCLPESALNIVYKALVLPLSDYTYNVHIDKLIRLQKRASKVIKFGKKRDKVDPILEKLNWNKFSDRLNFNTRKYIYKALNQLSSDYSKEFFNYVKRVNTRLGEDQLKLVIPNAKFNFLINTNNIQNLSVCVCV
jgi:hypothetical protein